jgi:uncharacterized repeat protein (TIGR03943 family)
VNRRAQAVVMALLGVAVLQASLTDEYLRYVKPGMRPLLVAAGLMLAVSGAMTLWYQRRRDPSHVDEAAGHDAHPPADAPEPAHAHSHEPRVAWLLLLPVVALAVVAPQALGADAASRAGTAVLAPPSDFTPLPDGDPVPVTLTDYASRAVFDEGRSLQDRRVRMTGFIMIGDDHVLYLARMIVTCCAADGRPIKVGLTGDVPDGLTADTWVSVTGSYNTRTVTDPVNGAVIPFVEVSQIEVVEQPDSPYQV